MLSRLIEDSQKEGALYLLTLGKLTWYTCPSNLLSDGDDTSPKLPSSTGENSSLEQHSQSTEDRAPLVRCHETHGHYNILS